MATLYLFVGYPGAGKTTLAEWICEATGAEHIWSDRERHAMFPNPTHSAQESLKLYAHLNQKAADILASGQSVVFDTSFNYRKDRDHLRSIAKEAGAETVLIWIKTDKSTAKNRATHNKHAERNNYETNMSEETFERIAGHLEPPRGDEPHFTFNGAEMDKASVLKAVGIN